MSKQPEYVSPTFSLVSINPDDRDDDMLCVPRWVLGLLAEELTGHTECGGNNDEAGCVRCDAIRVAKEASESGI